MHSSAFAVEIQLQCTSCCMSRMRLTLHGRALCNTEVYVWGRGEYGRLGLGDKSGSSKLRPTLVQSISGERWVCKLRDAVCEAAHSMCSWVVRLLLVCQDLTARRQQAVSLKRLTCFAAGWSRRYAVARTPLR